MRENITPSQVSSTDFNFSAKFARTVFGFSLQTLRRPVPEGDALSKNAAVCAAASSAAGRGFGTDSVFAERAAGRMETMAAER